MARNAALALQVPQQNINALGPQITIQLLQTYRTAVDQEIALQTARLTGNQQVQIGGGLFNTGTGTGTGQTTTGTATRRTMSPAARNRIKLAAKKRWADRRAAAATQTQPQPNGQIVQARGPARGRRSQRTMAAATGMGASA